MFSLIITIISIALVAALALATIYYGGNAFNKGSAEAKASQLINEGQQINGAVAMYNADSVSGADLKGTSFSVDTDSISNLSPTYLAQKPAGWEGTKLDGKAIVTGVKGAVCDAVNAKAGITGTRPADATALTGAGAAAGKVYGCFGAADANTVFYKF